MGTAALHIPADIVIHLQSKSPIVTVKRVTTHGIWTGNWSYWPPLTTNNYDSLTELQSPNIIVTTAHSLLNPH
jgi:hypothetical protein